MEQGGAEAIRDGVHRNGVTFVEYKGHRADYGTHRLPNGATFVGPSRERAIELLEERYGSGTERPGGGFLAMKKEADDVVPSKPCNEHLYNSLRNRAERRGAVVIRGGEFANKHLKKVGASASNMGDILIFRENPTTSDVLEEFFHLEQHYRGDYSELDGTEMFLRREIDAQKYLLSVSERVNIPKEEIEVTKANLARYEGDFDEYRKMQRR